MANLITQYICTERVYKYLAWVGKCRLCQEWGILEEEIRMTVDMGEFNRVLGCRIVPGSIVLIGGDPGIVKSTLLLQISNQIAKQVRGVLYISGEESIQQTKLRADRLKVTSDELYV